MKTSSLAKNIPVLSAIIVNYNSGERLKGAVRSVFDTVPDSEVIVVDNASMDNSLDILKASYVDEARLQIRRNRSNLGFATACNIGAKLARGHHLLYLNPDCEVHEDAVERMLACLNGPSDVGMVGPLLVGQNGQEQAGSRRLIPTPWRSLVRVFKLHVFSSLSSRFFADFNQYKQPLPDQPVEVEAISGACMLVSREAQQEVGSFDEKYFLHCEDLDLCMRFRASGWRVMFVPDAKVTHYAGTCSRERPVFVEFHKHKGMIRFYWKFFRDQYPGVLMWLVVAGVWTRFALLAAYYGSRQLFQLSGKMCG
ncbi:glycosyltransferase family 2 protein [Desulfolithobacter sp.]